MRGFTAVPSPSSSRQGGWGWGGMVITTGGTTKTSAPDFKTFAPGSILVQSWSRQLLQWLGHPFKTNFIGIEKGSSCLKVPVANCVLFPVILRCLIKDFEARPSVTHLLEHPFIKQAHGKETTLQQQLAALIQEQQEVGSKTRTRWVFYLFSILRFKCKNSSGAALWRSAFCPVGGRHSSL